MIWLLQKFCFIFLDNFLLGGFDGLVMLKVTAFLLANQNLVIDKRHLLELGFGLVFLIKILHIKIWIVFWIQNCSCCIKIQTLCLRVLVLKHWLQELFIIVSKSIWNRLVSWMLTHYYKFLIKFLFVNFWSRKNWFKIF